MKIITPDTIIKAFEDNAILPFTNLHPGLGVITSCYPSFDENMRLTSLVEAAEKYGAFIEIRRTENVLEALDFVKELSGYSDIYGIIILSDFGAAAKALASAIPLSKDIDCINYQTLGMLMGCSSNVGYRLGPCAAVAVMKILEYEHIDLAGKSVAILGRSLRVGRPLAEILSQKDATVTVFHSKSSYQCLSEFEIVISAIGKSREISYERFFDDGYPDLKNKLNTVLIDVGMNLDENGEVCGDFDFESFKGTNVSITPAPGCVNKIATMVLFGKLFVNAAEQKGESEK